MFFVEVNNGKITAKGCGPGKTNEQIEVTGEIYNELTNLPASFKTDSKGEIVSVTPEPKQTPPDIPTQEERLEALEQAMLELVLGGIE